MRLPDGFSDVLGAVVEVVDTNGRGHDPVVDLVNDMLVIRDNHELAVRSEECFCVLPEDVEERGPRIVGATNTKDDHGVPRRRPNRRHLLEQHRRGRKEDRAERLQNDHFT